MIFLVNRKNAKSISINERKSILPTWWNEILDTILSILKHSKYVSFKHAEQFLVTGLEYVSPEEAENEAGIKHIKVKCYNKGEHDNKIYITLEIFFYMKNKCLWKLTKSIHVFKRETVMSYD